MNDIVKSYNETAFAESQVVAKRFEKEHPDLMRKIENIIHDLTLQNCRVKDYFIAGTFINERNREYKNYLMTRDGFSLVAMSLTGKKAMEFKVKFIDAFNKMEAQLKKQSVLKLAGIETRKNLTDKIKESGENERMKGHGYSNYTKLAYKMIGIKYKKPAKGIRFRDSLEGETVERLENIEEMIKTLLKAGKQYEEIKTTVAEIFQTKEIN